ncbi:MAG: rod shape-determining protein MreC [Campylobacterales bacterium]|nr:rod shape-determining protein MreC [Campylobacterales bacterium]
MNKKLLSFIFVFFALFIGAFYYTDIIQTPIIKTSNYIKLSFSNTLEYIDNKIELHFFQANKIEHLKAKLKEYENNHLIMQELASELDDLFSASKSDLKSVPEVELVRSISYRKFGDLNQIWIEMKDYNSSKIYGLVYNELVAGIVIPQNEQPLALLNKDIKSAYSVFIGKDKAPGIAHGNNSEYLVVKFIPAWFKLNVGDEVITSGLDKIFFKGLKVGKVISFSSSQGYQSAVIEPYYKINNPNYFHVIKKIR